VNEVIKERDARRKYFMVFQSAWQYFLKALEEGEFYLPTYEEQMRSLLFAKCLEIMWRKRFEKPYKIFAENKETSTGARADITLGRWSQKGRFVAIELKNYPSLEGIKTDIRKLQRFVKDEAAAYGFFAMIGDSKDEYKTYLNLKDLGIEQEILESDEATIRFPRKVAKETEQSFYQWKLVKIPDVQRRLETLLVGIAS
jgi:hypothetical protein